MTDHNDGVEVQAYLGSVQLSGNFPWCAALPHWAYRQCGKVWEPSRAFAAAARWHVKDHRVWEQKGWVPDTARVFRPISRDCDCASLYYPSLGRIGHTLIRIDEDEDYITSIEGNTNGEGSREGNGVYIRKRLKKTLYTISRW